MNQPLFIETIKIKDGVFYNLPLHIARLERTAIHFYGVSPSLNLSEDIIPRSLRKGIVKCRITYSSRIESIEFEPYVFKYLSSLTLVEDNDIDYTYKAVDRSRINTLYSCRGKGREGSKVKPDLLAFGGDNKNPFYVLRPFLYKGAYKDSGTSYSAPLVSKVAGEMLNVAPTLTSQLIKNLLILNADLKRNDFIGHGFLNENVKEMLNCDKKNEITVVYQGEFQAGKALKLEIPYVDLKNYQGNVNIEFCLTTITSINPFDTYRYTNTGIELFFYPHSKKLEMKKRKIGEKNLDYTGVLNLLDENDIKKFEEYITEGYELKARPESRSTKKEKSEKLANSEDKKRAVKEIWDTVVKSSIGNMKMSSLYKPFIVLEGIGREGHDREFIKYALTVKIKLLKEYKGDLYTEIKNKYKMLSSLNIRQNLENRYKV